jgi:REP element-mobilizing transposase RayT
MLASHVIFGAYGFWLPNDPRGSWSEFVGSWELFRYGPATKTAETWSVAARPHDFGLRLAAKAALKRPAVVFSMPQIQAVAEGFADYAARSSVSVLACAILKDHVHLVLARHRLPPERLAVQLKSAAARRLGEVGLHPFAGEVGQPKCFARGEWKVFLDSEVDVRRAVQYVEENPVKEGLPRQAWGFVEAGVGRRVR